MSLVLLAGVGDYAQKMGLTLSQRQAVTKTKAQALPARADRAGKTRILDDLVELTGWHRDYARAALREALKLKVVKPRAPRSPTYGPRIIAALVMCWAVLRAPAGKRLAPMLSVLVPILRRDGELDLSDEEAELLCRMSAATIDRRLVDHRAKLMPRGRSHTKPGSLLKSQITWADWDDAVPGFVEIDLVGHEGGNASGEFCFTLTVTDIATGWTINRSRPGNKNDGAHVEQKNWARVRELVGYYRYDTASELAKLNEIWDLDAVFANYFLPQQKLVFKQRHGAKVTKRHDTATTPHQRTIAHKAVGKRPKITMNATFKPLRPAALSRQILALTGELEVLAQAKKAPRSKPPVNHTWNDQGWRRKPNEATT